jgi:hypothetical protein
LTSGDQPVTLENMQDRSSKDEKTLAAERGVGTDLRAVGRERAT